jgi:hypothetical protein
MKSFSRLGLFIFELRDSSYRYTLFSVSFQSPSKAYMCIRKSCKVMRACCSDFHGLHNMLKIIRLKIRMMPNFTSHSVIFLLSPNTLPTLSLNLQA